MWRALVLCIMYEGPVVTIMTRQAIKYTVFLYTNMYKYTSILDSVKHYVTIVAAASTRAVNKLWNSGEVNILRYGSLKLEWARRNGFYVWTVWYWDIGGYNGGLDTEIAG